MADKKKSGSITHSRYACAIGAVHTVSAIKRAIPIANCGPGCTDKQFIMMSFSNGFQGADYCGGGATPSVNVGENEIIFGGQKKLKQVLNASFKIMEGDLFVVLTGCVGELIGDDVGAIVKEYQKKGYPVVYADAAGFKGNNLIGHEAVVKAIIDQYVGDYDGEKKKGLINLWSEVPYFDTNWKGDYSELKRILEGAGFEVNVLFGIESKGVESWKKIPEAQFNLLVSPWVGLKTVEHLQKKYDQPFLHIPVIPIGEKETSAFIRKVVDYAGIDSARSEVFIKEESERYYYYVEHFSEFLSEYWFGLPARYSIAADASNNLAITKFLTDQIGLIPVKAIITDNTPDRYKELIQKEYENISEDVSVEVQFIEDGYQVEQEIENADYGLGRPLIFGSSWDIDVAKKKKALFVEVSTPNNSEVVLNRSYIGYRGALTLLEKIYSEVVRE
ncbi:nitrogenase molybdenum-iron protein beta chain [[Clostridium] polysaccharolyticum]|uniref:Nitrogenase molybdenum-iron protein beta chain n=2 Tax=[Clostridium] polysaccharolyticum TaxID=29364 RepID=A0A1I0BWM3_9FIRM|nr:nitrogenase molybdenum-iron protein beta chain [[Clostridium] polysaccharolyticum]